MVSACLEAHRLTGDRALGASARASRSTGSSGRTSCSDRSTTRRTGGCRDGLHADRVNENQGAESTLSFLLALTEMRAADRADARQRQQEEPSHEPYGHDPRIRDALSAPHGQPDPHRRRLAVSRAHRLQPRRDAPAPTARRCSSAASRIAAATRTCARRARRTASTAGSSTQEPTLRPDPEHYPEELWGIEDPRITFVEELGKYAVAYTAFSKGGPGVALALTEDFRRFERLRPRHAARRQGRGAAAAAHRRQLRAPPPPDDRLGRARLDLVLARSAQLGQPQADPAGAQGRVVGRQQGRPVAAAHRDRARLADALPRRAPHGVGQPLSARARALRARQAGAVPARAATRGSSDPRRPTSARATSATWRSPAATPSAPTATRSTSTTAAPTPASRWRPAAFAGSSRWLDEHGTRALIIDREIGVRALAPGRQ